VNFALYSEHAERVELCLFDPKGRREIERVELTERTGFVWHCYLPEARPGLLYGYRVHGPQAPERGHRFNPNRVLLDPYARLLAGQVSAGMGRSRVVDPAFSWGGDRPPRTPWQDTLIYELHVKGFTQLHPGVPEQLRGTYAGLASAPAIEHLQRLGVTAVELLPIHAFVDERRLLQHGLRNYWGYSSIGYFAPEMRYASTGTLGEFKTMVKTLHSAGIEVILDVVYNHTGEGDHHGPTLSFRGIDNLTYYRLDTHNLRHYVDTTGTGNSLNASHPAVLALIMDSLRYWAEEMHVDGFRFDLATTLVRDHSAFLAAMAQDPVLSQVKLIAEPWDLAPDGYRLGRFPPPWSEWNDKYRDSVRAYWKGDENMIGEFAPGIEIPLRPFFGSMGVAPPPAAGRISSNPPGIHAGNLDNKELVAGTTLFIPIHVKGALFEVGDGHAAQGDGEVDQTGIETSLRGKLQLTVRKGMKLAWPRAETSQYFISMGTDVDLRIATRIAIQEMVDFLASTKKMDKHQAYQLTSLQGDVAITFEGGWLKGAMDAFPDIKWQFAEMPTGSSGQKVTINYTAAYGIGQDSVNKDQAWVVMQYLTGPEGMAKWTEGGIAVPSRSDVAVPEGFDVIVKGADYAKPGSGFMPAYPDVIKAFGDEFLKQVTDKTYDAAAVVAATKAAIETALSAQ